MNFVEDPFKAIADANRRRILELVADRERTAGEIAEHFAVTRPAVSQHLAALRRAGLVSERREGTRRLYRIRPQGLGEPLLFLQAFWDGRLARLRRAAEDPADPEASPLSERVTVTREVIIAARDGPSASAAPARISASTTRRFTLRGSTRRQKSNRSL